MDATELCRSQGENIVKIDTMDKVDLIRCTILASEGNMDYKWRNFKYTVPTLIQTGSHQMYDTGVWR